MQKSLVCAACLATDVRMYSMDRHGLLEAFQLLTGRQIFDGMPRKLCWECGALLNKFDLFRQKCGRAYSILQDIYSRHHVISKEECSEIDRKASNLMSAYACSGPHSSTYAHGIRTSFVEDDDNAKHEEYCVEFPKSEDENTELKDKFCSDVKSEIDLESDNVPLFFFNKQFKLSKKRKKFLKQKSSQKKLCIENTKTIEETEIKTKYDNSESDHDNVDLEIEVDIKEETEIPEVESQFEPNNDNDETIKPKKTVKLKIAKSLKSKRQSESDVISLKVSKPKRGKGLKEKRNGKPKEKSVKKTSKNKMLVGKKREPMNKKVDFKDFATAVMVTQEQQTAEVQRRRLTASYREAAFKCELCYKGFVNEKAFANHTRKHDPATGEYQCDVCKSRFKKRYYVADHIYKVHMTKYVCKFCPFVSQCVYQASTHYKWHKGVVYTCNICREEFTTKSTYLSHRRIKHATEHVCGACGESFVSRLGLLQHRSRLHTETPLPDDSGPYCAACDVHFSCREAWTKHMVISPRHAGELLVLNGCRDCGVSFATEKELRSHRRAQHRRQKVRAPGDREARADGYPVKCEQCDEVVENARRYWQHFRREHPAEQYPSNNPAICEYCGKGFKCKSVLAHHRNTHTGKRGYACALCPKAFFTPQNLENHLKSHSESRPHVCDVCSKGFKFSVALLRHRRIHTGEKPYVCDVCGKAFTDSSGRKVHVRTVHLKEPTPYVSKARLERRRQAEVVKNIHVQN